MRIWYAFDVPIRLPERAKQRNHFRAVAMLVFVGNFNLSHDFGLLWRGAHVVPSCAHHVTHPPFLCRPDWNPVGFLAVRVRYVRWMLVVQIMAFGQTIVVLPRRTCASRATPTTTTDARRFCTSFQRKL